MSQDIITELTILLQKALPHISVRYGPSERLSLIKYRELLELGRSPHDPQQTGVLSFCRLEFHDPEVNDELLTFVTEQLEPYIRDGKVHAATYAFSGGLTSGSPVSGVVSNLLKLALVDGPSRAAQAFSDCITSPSCHFYQFFVLAGIRIESPIQLITGIDLIPFPTSPSGLPPHAPFLHSFRNDSSPFNVQYFLGKTVLRVRFEVSPIFCRPRDNYTFDSTPDDHFQVTLATDELQDLNVQSAL